MSMIFEIPFDKVVKLRYSVRTYTSQKISQDMGNQINKYINTLSNPFSLKISFQVLHSETTENAKKLGTYGMIKGAGEYIGATVKNAELSMAALGYEFEKLILYLTSLGLGTCWLGGTFNRGEFAKAMEIKENELFPIISPIGYASEKKRMTDSLVRFFAKSDQRKPWESIFFHKNFSTPLAKADAGQYEEALEMIRLAPSASNKQPWRILKDGSAYHFFENKAKGYSDSFGYDIQEIDMGIAACHFHLAALEKGLEGEFAKLPLPEIEIPENIYYLFSYMDQSNV